MRGVVDKNRSRTHPTLIPAPHSISSENIDYRIYPGCGDRTHLVITRGILTWGGLAHGFMALELVIDQSTERKLLPAIVSPNTHSDRIYRIPMFTKKGPDRIDATRSVGERKEDKEVKIRSRLICSRLISPQAPTGQFSGGENAVWWTFPPCPLQVSTFMEIYLKR